MLDIIWSLIFFAMATGSAYVMCVKVGGFGGNYNGPLIPGYMVTSAISVGMVFERGIEKLFYLLIEIIPWADTQVGLNAFSAGAVCFLVLVLHFYAPLLIAAYIHRSLRAKSQTAMALSNTSPFPSNHKRENHGA